MASAWFIEAIKGPRPLRQSVDDWLYERDRERRDAERARRNGKWRTVYAIFAITAVAAAPAVMCTPMWCTLLCKMCHPQL
jgi:hypothetical protein